MSLFAEVPLAPADPILGMTEAFNADPRPDKVNLAIGVYLDESGKLPLLTCVQKAAAENGERSWSYLPIDGLPVYNDVVRNLVFGPNSLAVEQGRVVTVQSLGGTGALKIGAAFLNTHLQASKALVSNPSWSNHRSLFASNGFEVNNYTYYDAANKTINFEAMLNDLRRADQGTVVVFHACCHNPTGYDLTADQWQEVAQTVIERGLIAFLDLAYQGFGESVELDRTAIGIFADCGAQFFVANSFSKTFSLYGERVGALSIVTNSSEEARRVLSQLKTVIRTDYSNPPTHGASLVAYVLNNEQLRQQWETELGQMRQRISRLRKSLVEGLVTAGLSDMKFILNQQGMFSYSGLAKPEMVKLREEYGIYGLDSGRICIAALNMNNLDRVISAIVSVRNSG